MYACIHTAELSVQAKLREIADAFSPLVENSAPGMVVFEISGLETLIGNDFQVASAIATAATKSGIRANVALASNPNAAVAAAVNIENVTVIPEGSEIDILGDIPIKAFCSSPMSLDSISMNSSSIDFDSNPMNSNPMNSTRIKSNHDAVRRRIEIVDTLRAWGINSFRDFAGLPESRIFERLGQEGVLLHRFARGQLPRHLRVDLPPAPFEESIELDDAIDNLEPLSFVVSGLTDRLCAALAGRALATHEIRLLLRLDDKEELAYAIRLPFPSQDGRTLGKLLIMEVQLNPPLSPVVFIHVSAVPVIPRVTQNQLFEQATPEPEKLELTLARIARLVGDNNIGSPAPLDTHRPDAFGIKRLAISKLTISKNDRRGRKKLAAPQKNLPAPQPRLALRRFRPPLPATVEQRDGRPASISAPGHGFNKNGSNKNSLNKNGSNKIVRGRVIMLSGPWRTSGDWWDPEPWSRDEWDAALSDGAVYRIYYDFKSTAWFVEGVYD
jgi:protein ImuB